jgi:hypothetical protein
MVAPDRAANKVILYHWDCGLFVVSIWLVIDYRVVRHKEVFTLQMALLDLIILMK